MVLAPEYLTKYPIRPSDEQYLDPARFCLSTLGLISYEFLRWLLCFQFLQTSGALQQMEMVFLDHFIGESLFILVTSLCLAICLGSLRDD